MIDGRQSRQDVGVLQQIASRLGGEYHDGNVKHIPTKLLAELGTLETESEEFELTRREYALILATISALGLAFLPFILNYIGTPFSPGSKKQTL